MDFHGFRENNKRQRIDGFGKGILLDFFYNYWTESYLLSLINHSKKREIHTNGIM